MSNDYPLVSIIIPTYNSSDYITETLTKLEKQTYPNFEIVIVNDGSKDNTSNVLREYGLTHSRLIIINKENGGVSSARNTGIRKAQGQFICFMDDDDEIDPNYLLKMYSRQHETGGDAIYCGLYGHHIKNGVTYSPINTDFNEGSLLFDFFYKKVRFHIGCLFIRKQLLEDNNLFFDEDLRLGEDLDFIYRLLITCDMYAVPYYMYKHNYRENSLMNSCRTITHYRHESFAHERIYSSVMQLYKGNRKEEIHTLLSKNRTYHKTRYLWNVLLNGDFELLNQLEWFSMHFMSDIAEEKTVYQSLHQIYLKTIKLYYPHIAYLNRKGIKDKYYCNIIGLYVKWANIYHKEKEDEVKRNKKISDLKQKEKENTTPRGTNESLC